MEPFDTLRDRLPGWTVAITALEGIVGFCDYAHHTIWVDLNLTEPQRRTRIMRETFRALCQGTPDADVEIAAAEQLIPISALIAALDRSTHPADICDTLDVDDDLLRTRLSNLSDTEAHAVRRRLVHNGATEPSCNAHCALARWWIQHDQPGTLPCRCCVHAERTAIIRPMPIRPAAVS